MFCVNCAEGDDGSHANGVLGELMNKYITEELANAAHEMASRSVS